MYIDTNLVRQEVNAPYEWGHDGSPNPNELNNLGVGTHVFRGVVTDNRGATAETSFVLTVTESALSIPEIKNENNIEIFPNPIENGVLTIQQKSSNTVEIFLYNIDGKLVYSTETSAKTTKITELHMISGLYILKIKNGDQLLKMEKVIFK